LRLKENFQYFIIEQQKFSECKSWKVG